MAHAVHSPPETLRFEQLLVQHPRTSGSRALPRLREALHTAQTVYADRMHWTGESILEHCLGVLQTFLTFDPDDDALIACLLHHITEDTSWTLAKVEQKFGPVVRQMISGIHLFSYVTSNNQRMTLESMRLMFLKVSSELPLVVLLLSHQHQLLKHLSVIGVQERRRLGRDTLQLYAPVAARLGIYWLKQKLESLAFPVLYPVDSVKIVEQLEECHRRYGEFLPDVALELRRYLHEAGVAAEVAIREKQPYSIFQKMKEKTITHVEDLNDLYAVRVIVREEAECYQTLGLLHRIGHPIVGKFKDYIAFPKPNGYQSLHTTLARLSGVPEKLCVEVQVRTLLMQQEAELGIAAHWSYKEGGTAEHAAERARLQRALTQHLIPRDHIFVLTPRGDIIELPEGATTLDFAFHVHTTLGLSFRAAKVNGSIVPLDHALENGDIVEILRHADPRPSPRWMQLLRTASARSRLKRYLAMKSGERAPPDVREKITVSEKRAVKKKIALVARVEGLIPMPVRFARCCKPDAGGNPPLAGVIGRRGDVCVHAVRCKMLNNVNPGRRVGVKWGERS